MSRLITALAGLALIASPLRAADRPPNIVLIIADDLGCTNSAATARS